MSQLDLVLYEMEKRGGRIRTSELTKIAAQYQRVLNGLRKKGFEISSAIKTEIRGENEYVLYKYPFGYDRDDQR